MPGPPTAAAPKTLRFGDFELDLPRGVLLHRGARLRLQPQPYRVLEHLALRAPAIVTREELGEAIWSGVHVDLDQGLNYCIRQIRSALNESASEPRYIETLPKQGYRFIAPIQDSPGISAAAALPTTALPPARQRVRPALLITAATLALLATVAIFAAWHRRAASSTAIQSIAVLPLENYSGDPAQQYFADGMTDELITSLARGTRLRVVSRTSVMQYQGVHRPLADIARELNVDAILEGSISLSGDKVHMNLQFIQAPSDTHLWAQTYDRDLAQRFTLPQQAAEDIATSLHDANPSASAAARPVLPEAHDEYLRGRYLWFNGQTQLAGQHFLAATRLQPDYAQAWSGLSFYYAASAIKGELSPADSIDLTAQIARKAIALDNKLPEAHIGLSATYLLQTHDLAAALAESDRAIALDPHYAEAYHFKAKVLSALQRHDEAIQTQRRAAELDPSARPWALAQALALARRYDDALHEAQQRIESNPHDPAISLVLAGIYRRMGRPADYATTLALTFDQQGDPSAAAALRSTFARSGYPGMVRWQLQRLQARATKTYVSPVDFALLHAQLQEREQTLALLEEAARQQAPALLWIQADPAFDFLRDDPRLHAALQHTGLPIG